VAIAGSEQANKALEYASNIAMNFEAKVTLLLVAESKLFRLEPEAVRTIGENILFDAATKFKGINFEKRLGNGSPAESIIRVARQENFDMIVLGSRGLSTVKRFLLGSVSADVSMHTRRSVLIVR
jgi:nucleotide-binding universal stress UspA family protein